MKKLTLILLFTGLISIHGGNPAHAATFELTAGIGKLSGETTYRIGYPVDFVYFGTEEGYFPFSQLEFPLDVSMLSLDGNIEFSNTCNFSLRMQSNITNDPGNMKDSDWITPSDPTRLDIFSTSDTDLDALVWDINLGYMIYESPRFSLILRGGYLRQSFDFKCRLIRQYSPSGLPGYDYVGDGSVGITYEITYEIPYLEVGIQSDLTNSFSMGASLGYSPIVTVKDKDRHLLRNKVNTGNLEGDAFMFSLEARYNMFTNWFFTCSIDYLTIQTDKGNMVATFDGPNSVYDHTVTEEAESTQTSAMVTLGYAFN